MSIGKWNGPRGGGIKITPTSVIRDRLYIKGNYPDPHVSEANPDSKATIENYPTGEDNSYGVGGIETRLFSHFYSGGIQYWKELNPHNPLSHLNSADAAHPWRHIGGIHDRLFVTKQSSGTPIDEINVDTFAVINSLGYTLDGSGRGVGGLKSSDRLYVSAYNPSEIAEINPDTGAILQQSSSPYNSGSIGGVDTRLYYTDLNNGRLYEVNPDTLASLGYANNTHARYGVGGIAPINYDLNIEKLVDDIVGNDIRTIVYDGRTLQ